MEVKRVKRSCGEAGFRPGNASALSEARLASAAQEASFKRDYRKLDYQRLCMGMTRKTTVKT